MLLFLRFLVVFAAFYSVRTGLPAFDRLLFCSAVEGLSLLGTALPGPLASNHHGTVCLRLCATCSDGAAAKPELALNVVRGSLRESSADCSAKYTPVD